VIKAVEWDNDRIRLLDQTLLPHEEVYIELTGHREVADAITGMKVRGAPAIGITAAFGLALGAQEIETDSREELLTGLRSISDTLAATRPTAVNLFRALERLNREAEKRGLLLGVENRYHYHQMPDYDEIGLILDRFSGGSIRYWHDLGHAHTLERLGIVDHGSLLRTYASFNAGIHIHDAIGTDDHFAPGSGEIDFTGLADWLRSPPIKILEVHKKSDRLEVMNGMEMLKSIGIV